MNQKNSEKSSTGLSGRSITKYMIYFPKSKNKIIRKTRTMVILL